LEGKTALITAADQGIGRATALRFVDEGTAVKGSRFCEERGKISLFLKVKGARNLMHFINLTGHSDTAYFNPVSMKNIQVRVKGDFRSAKALRSGQTIAIDHHAGYAEFTLPSLDEYELLDLG
jgi:NAD(P)-dependent dehydrogenase (short-subunit alcohol dehydrogenase family)